MRTVLDLAAFTTFAEAIVPLDHVLRPDTVKGLPALSKETLLAGIEGNYTSAAARRIAVAVYFATGRAVVRWVWSDLMMPGRLERKLAAAGVPRRRARSGH